LHSENQNQSRLSLENISMQMTSQVIIFREHILEGKLSLKTGLNCFYTTFWQLNKPLHYQLMGKMSHQT